MRLRIALRVRFPCRSALLSVLQFQPPPAPLLATLIPQYCSALQALAVPFMIQALCVLLFLPGPNYESASARRFRRRHLLIKPLSWLFFLH